MTQAFKTSLPSTQKFVLVALCDSANDQGECYPSVRLVAEKCSLGERTVQEAVTALEVSGYVRREFRAGRSTVYWLSTTPAAAAPPQDTHPRGNRTPAATAPAPAAAAPLPPQIAHPTPAAAAPITINEPSVEPSKKRKSSAPDLTVGTPELVAAGFDMATAEEFIACKAKRKAPLTPRAWADHLREAEKAGWTPLAAAEKVMAKTWKGFEAAYVANERGAAVAPFPTAKQRDAADAAEFYRKSTGGRLGGKLFDANVIDMEASDAAQIGNG